MNRFSKDLIEALTEALAHAEGKSNSVRVHVVNVPKRRASEDRSEIRRKRRAGKRNASRR
jgi:hypothetical protein